VGTRLALDASFWWLLFFLVVAGLGRPLTNPGKR
jgi:hypothetical protein